MLVKNARVPFPTIVYFVGNADGRKNIESKILALGAKDIRMAIEPAEADAAGDIRDEARAWLREVVTETERDTEVMVFRSTRERLRHENRVDLVIALEPT